MSLLARPRAARFAIPILLATLWAVAPGSGESGREWTTSSFLDFVDGALTDGGANTYVGADGTVRLINLWDLNDDGQLDLLFPSSHDHNEKVDLFIYWGRSGFDPAGRTRLPSNGGKAVAIADLNQDRQPDLIVVNRFNGTRSDLDSFIYWGSRGGFEPGRRTLLPTRGAEAVAVADLNGDGWKEVVFANSGLSYHVPVDRFNRSFIYWGAASGYSPDRRTSLKTVLARDVEIADLDRDGALDLVFASEGNEDEESGAWIYWGDGSGDFSGRPPTRLPGQRSAAVAATDLNGDGWTDLVLANRFRLRAREMGIYNIIDTVAVDSYVYWGSREGYAAGKRTELPTVAARDVEAADLNGDGRPDLVFANGAGGASYIYWASDSGFHPHKRSALPTSEAAGVEVEDINRDGSPDLVFAQRGDRRTEDGGSLIYWGGARDSAATAGRPFPPGQRPESLSVTWTPTARKTWFSPTSRTAAAKCRLSSTGALPMADTAGKHGWSSAAAAPMPTRRPTSIGTGSPISFSRKRPSPFTGVAGSPIPPAGPPRWTPSRRYREGSPTSIAMATWTWR